MMTPEAMNKKGADTLQGWLGIVITHISTDKIMAELVLKSSHMAPNGFLHAGTVVTLADTACGNGCIMHLPEGATGFTTVELKSNHLGTAREGIIECIARPVHKGRTTQVWDAIVSARASGRTIALFRCTQMILYP